MHAQIWCENLKDTYHLEDLDIGRLYYNTPYRNKTGLHQMDSSGSVMDKWLALVNTVMYILGPQNGVNFLTR